MLASEARAQGDHFGLHWYMFEHVDDNNVLSGLLPPHETN